MKIIEVKPLSKPIHAEIEIPGSKSYTNRSLLLAAMSNQTVKIINPLISDDTKAMINCLKTLGIKILIKDNHIEVLNNIKAIRNLQFDLDANESGTTIRFLLALATIIPGVKTLYGKEGLNRRPIGDLVEGLRFLGADINYLGKEGYPPVVVSSSKLNPGTFKIEGSISSQFTAALLMIAPLIGEVVIEIIGKQSSRPFVDMTIDIMQQFGVRVENMEDKKYVIPAGQIYRIKEYEVEGDVSSASYFFALAALTKSTIIIKNLNSDSVQADMKFLKILEGMGNKIVPGENQITIIGKGIKSIIVDMVDCPDQVQTLAVLAAFAKGTTQISGVQSLRIKETDRILALRQELKKMGIRTSSTKDTLTIYGGNPKTARIETYGDHRMAMSFAVAGAKLAGMEITDPDVVNKTFPTFWKELNSIGVKTKMINDKNIVLIGMRGSGKTTVAKILSKKLNRQYLELDEIIVKKVSLSIPEMVKKYGWDFFRDKESEVVKEISSSNCKVVSTGGGVIIKPQNVDALKKNGIFIYLNASVETLLKRIGDNSSRPALTNKKSLKEEMEDILKQREHQYRKVADEVIDTDDLNPIEVTDKIISRMEGATL